jgi:multidrug transporter EmrE-like cation transporter
MKTDVFHGMLASWAYIFLAVSVALIANAVSMKWASDSHLLNRWFLPMMLISPLVFITFGLTASRMGLAVGSASIDSMLTVATVLFGLIFFREWKTLSSWQYLGIFFLLCGIALVQLEKTPSS